MTRREMLLWMVAAPFALRMGQPPIAPKGPAVIGHWTWAPRAVGGFSALVLDIPPGVREVAFEMQWPVTAPRWGGMRQTRLLVPIRGARRLEVPTIGGYWWRYRLIPQER